MSSLCVPEQCLRYAEDLNKENDELSNMVEAVSIMARDVEQIDDEDIDTLTSTLGDIATPQGLTVFSMAFGHCSVLDLILALDCFCLSKQMGGPVCLPTL